MLANEERRLADYTKNLADYTLALAVFTAALGVVGGLQFFALRSQARTLQHHSEHLRNSVEELKRSVAAYERYARVSEEALSLTRESNITTRQATELTRQSILLAHRPKLSIRRVMLSDEDRALSEGSFVEGEFCVVNDGGTTAQIEEMFATARRFPQLPMRPIYAGSAHKITPAVLRPGETKHFRFSKDDGPLTSDDLVSIRWLDKQGEPRDSIYVLGFLKYSDGGNTPIIRQTFFCRRLNIPECRFEPVDNPDYERAD
ncbi:MAG: hypothetical protein ABSC08_02505 [Bryobacteraceae bacterium]|jgi:hypothetical protein